MLSLEKCYEILNKNKKKYTKTEVTIIREKLYDLIHIIDKINTQQNE